MILITFSILKVLKFKNKSLSYLIAVYFSTSHEIRLMCRVLNDTFLHDENNPTQFKKKH